jgi:hypothetical protein
MRAKLKDKMTVAQTMPDAVLSGFLGAGSRPINDLLTDPKMADTAMK